MSFEQLVFTRWLGLRLIVGCILTSTTTIDRLIFDGSTVSWARAFSYIPSLPGCRRRSQLCGHKNNPSERVTTKQVRDFNSGSDAVDRKTSDVNSNVILTTAVLKIAYDGTYFRGWTGDKHPESTQKNSTGLHKLKQKQSRRSRTLQRKGSGHGRDSNTIRTVDNVLRISLAKLYGNVSPNDVVFDSCSRTDAGVHATSLIAQFYCSPRYRKDLNFAVTSNVTWSQLRPGSPTDSNFLPLPFDSNLPKLVFVLNRMLPPDVRIIAASPAPFVPGCTPVKGVQEPVPGEITQSYTMNKYFQPFHPTLHVKTKTYMYQFAVGPIQDPMRSQHIWHLDGSSHRAVGMNGRKFCFQRALEAANAFVEKIQPRDYSAFRSAFRGNDRGRVQSSICTLWRCDLFRESAGILPSWEKETTVKPGSRLSDIGLVHSIGSHLGSTHYNATNVGTFSVVITGDRFLYKMIRHIVGTIVAVACGHLEVSDIRQALGGDENVTSGNLDMQSHTNGFGMRRICAPARGLALCSVEYQDDILFDWQTG